MGKRRMFSQSIVESDAFLDMPMSSQALYFHLCMEADDYGFVSPKRVMRMIGASADDLKILIAKRYVLVFESGVAVIKHWHNHNTVRKDRSKETSYQLEFKTLTYNEFGAYTEKRVLRRKIKTPLTESLQSPVVDTHLTGTKTETSVDAPENDNQRLPQIRLDKIRLDKTNSSIADKSAVNGEKIKKLYYDIISAYGLPVRNHNNVKAAIGKLRKEMGDDDAIVYLDFVLTRYLKLDYPYKPEIGEALDIHAKRQKIIDSIKRQANKHQKTKGFKVT